MRIVRIGEPFIPVMLEGVCVHVHVQSEGDEQHPGWHVRVIIQAPGAQPHANGHDHEVATAASRAVAEDMLRRPATYDDALEKLEAARALSRDRKNKV